MSREATDENSYNFDLPALRRAIPLACFVLACKHVETWSPRLTDVARQASALDTHGPCSSQDVHDAELRVLFTLDWNIDPLSAIDVAHELLAFAPLGGNVRQREELSRRNSKELHQNIIVAALCQDLCRKPPAEVATACILDACYRTGLSSEFVPLFLKRNNRIHQTQLAIRALRPTADPMLLKWLSLPSE